MLRTRAFPHWPAMNRTAMSISENCLNTTRPRSKNVHDHIVKKNNEKQDEYYSNYRDNLFDLNKIEDILIELNIYNEEEELI